MDLLYINVINKQRFNDVFFLTKNSHWLSHVLDRLIYRCQNSTLTENNQRCFTEKLENLAKFIGASSIRTLQTDLTTLEKLGLITRKAVMTIYGKQCFISLSQSLWNSLVQKIAVRDDNASVHWQAENHYRYDSITPLFHENNGRKITILHHIVNYLMLRTQYQSASEGTGFSDTWIAVSQDHLADVLNLSLRTLQRYLQQLEQNGLLVKRKRKRSAAMVETAYSITSKVWEAANKGNLAMGNCVNAAKNKIAATSCINIRQHEDFGGSQHEDFGGCNNSKNKKDYSNKKHSTMNSKNNHLKKAQVGNPMSSNSLPLETDLSVSPSLNRRQLAYVQATLDRLQTQHGCHFSDPTGLQDEVLFSLTAVNHVLPQHRSFRYRLNVMAKLLRERRWTTPHGFERYDAKGKARKQQRDAREAAWAAEKAKPVSLGQQTPLTPSRTGAMAVGMLVATALSSDSENQQGRASSPVASEVTHHLQAMQKLAAKAAQSDCSALAREGIQSVMLTHQRAIQALMAA